MELDQCIGRRPVRVARCLGERAGCVVGGGGTVAVALG